MGFQKYFYFLLYFGIEILVLFEKKGLLVQTGNRLKYIDSTGKEHIDFRKAWTGPKLDMLMEDFDKLSRESEAKND